MEETAAHTELKKPTPPEEKLLRTRTFLEKYSKYFPLIPPLFLIIVLAGVYIVVNGTAAPSQTTQLLTPTQPLPTSSPTPTFYQIYEATDSAVTTNISEWKTFTANGYSFKYPSDWKVAKINNLNTVQITNAAKTVGIKVSDSNYPFGQSEQVEATSKHIQLEIFDTMYTVNETTINNSGVFIGFQTDTIPPRYILFGTGYPTSGQKSLNDYEDSKSTIVKILSTFKFTQ